MGLALATRSEAAARPDAPAISAASRARSAAAAGPLGAAVAIVGVAAAAWFYLGGGYPNLDTAYAVVWGDQILDGALPDYDVESAPTPHPLATALGALAALLGGGAYDALAMVAYLSLGGLVWGVYALGRECYSWRVGLLGALVVATSYTVVSRTAASYLDGVAVALILLAALLEASGRRGVPVLVVLGIVGLQRPEAWLLAACYWLYLVPQLGNRERLRLALLAAAAPAVWAVADLIVTGNPFYSGTGGTQEAVQVSTGVDHESQSVLSVTVSELREILRLPLLLGGLVGVALALAFLRARSRIPMALLAFGLVSFVGLGLGGLPLVDRFLFLAAAMLAIFFGVAVVGWMEPLDLARSRTRARRLRAAWVIGALALMIGLIVSVPLQVDRFQGLRDEVGLRAAAVDDLRALANSGSAGAVLRRCEHVYVPNRQLTPLLSYALDRSPRDVTPSPPRPPRQGAYLAPGAELRAADAFFLRSRAGPSAPADFDRVADSRYWIVRARGCGV